MREGNAPPRPHCPAPRRRETLGLLSFHLEYVVTNSEGVVHTTEDTWEQAILQKQITIRKRNGRRTASIKPR